MTLDEFDDDSCLIYGIGNVGRQDDGLGWAFVDWLQAEGRCSNAEIQKGYQLLLEDAELISNKQRVLFVDATKDTSVASFTLGARGAENGLQLHVARHLDPCDHGDLSAVLWAPAGSSRTRDQGIRIRTRIGVDAGGTAEPGRRDGLLLLAGRVAAVRSADQV